MSTEATHVYKVFAGELVSMPITKTTKCRFYVRPCKENSFSLFYDKAHACVTAEEAVQEYFNKALARFRMFQDRMDSVVLNLDVARKLCEKYHINCIEE